MFSLPLPGEEEDGDEDEEGDAPTGKRAAEDDEVGGLPQAVNQGEQPALLCLDSLASREPSQLLEGWERRGIGNSAGCSGKPWGGLERAGQPAPRIVLHLSSPDERGSCSALLERSLGVGVPPCALGSAHSQAAHGGGGRLPELWVPFHAAPAPLALGSGVCTDYSARTWFPATHQKEENAGSLWGGGV